MSQCNSEMVAIDWDDWDDITSLIDLSPLSAELVKCCWQWKCFSERWSLSLVFSLWRIPPFRSESPSCRRSRTLRRDERLGSISAASSRSLPFSLFFLPCRSSVVMSVSFYLACPIAFSVLPGEAVLLFLCCVCFSRLLSLLPAFCQQLTFVMKVNCRKTSRLIL